jgi:CRISPR-associated protein (TIGR02710 family)
MSTILFVTVGGSHQPIVTAISSLNPDRVIFICSDGAKGSKSQVIGTGTPCEVRKGLEVIERLPNIPTQAKLGDKFQPERDVVTIDEPDDLSECYQKIVAAIQAIQQSAPKTILKADYTGGTKSMSVGLAMAAIDYRVEVFLTTGNRTDLIRVQRGEMTAQATISPVLIQRTIDRFLPMVLQQYNYPAAVAELTQLLPSMTVTNELRRQIQSLCSICKGLDAWDRFEHLEAVALLTPYMKSQQIQPLGLFLKRVIHSRGAIDPDFKFDLTDSIAGHGYEIVQDLLLNAERRATQGRYDDAVGRLYRALELLVQVRLLKAYEIETGDVDLAKLPEHLRHDFHPHGDRKIQIALRRSYDLLAQLGDDPIGQLYRQQKGKVISALEIRNDSLFAHGFQPITEQNYQSVLGAIGSFIETSIERVAENKFKSVTLQQFPTDLIV